MISTIKTADFWVVGCREEWGEEGTKRRRKNGQTDDQMISLILTITKYRGRRRDHNTVGILFTLVTQETIYS